MKLHSKTRETERALSRQGHYRSVKGNLRVKEVSVGDGESSQRFIVCHNPAEAERDRLRHEQRVAHIEAELEHLKLQRERAKTRTRTKQEAHQRAERALCDHPGALQVSTP